MEKYICIHGHFYQPPRENPWLEEVEHQESAHPYHDWNERITAECYEPNAAARILSDHSIIKDIVNNYAKISFNFGPTLLSWMERHQPNVYAQILKADQLSQENFSGHGSAIAQVYNHIIMPLANRRDKETQIIWGIKDFAYRFKRQPEGMWLAETAVDLETLEILSDHGIKFTILDSHQAHKVRKIGHKNWHDVTGGKIDPRKPYLCQLPNGRAITLFFYDSPIAQDVAFSGVLKSGEAFAGRLMQPFTEENQPAQLVHIATDGETYGHHHRYGDMALAYCLNHIEEKNLAKITVYGEYMEKFPPQDEVVIYENSSWSCFHGVERWRNDCGCNSGMNPGWSQAWRAPLRQALDYLRDVVIPLYEEKSQTYVKDPWALRNAYIDVVLDRSEEQLNQFLSAQIPGNVKAEDKSRLLKLLEIERHAMLMYTSCGWFFDELSGIETVQIMHYAARVIQLARELFEIDLEKDFVEKLKLAPSNLPRFGDGLAIWEEYVHPRITDLAKVGADYVITALFDQEVAKEQQLYCYEAFPDTHVNRTRGEEKLGIGKIKIRSLITREECLLVYAVLHMGGHNLSGGVRPFISEEAFAIMKEEVDLAFEKGDIPETILLIREHCGPRQYSLWHLFKDEQRRIFNYILNSAMQETEGYYRRIYEHHYAIIRLMSKSHVPLPKILSTTIEFVLITDICDLLEREDFELEQLQHLVREINKWDFKRDRATLNFVASKAGRRMIEKFETTITDTALLIKIEKSLALLQSLGLDLNLWKAQNIYYDVYKRYYPQYEKAAKEKDQTAIDWLQAFTTLGKLLKVNVTANHDGHNLP